MSPHEINRSLDYVLRAMKQFIGAKVEKDKQESKSWHAAKHDMIDREIEVKNALADAKVAKVEYIIVFYIILNFLMG